ncbi:cytochrome P450 [Viridothelium virens]|uniref:Cytochrome P450 n=1 Tax=Viridothelium virens TaxID=1048519 RepID=A0A6A6H676_VIRVR|nr:cytochrome P450 [Viridothelium virens]
MDPIADLSMFDLTLWTFVAIAIWYMVFYFRALLRYRQASNNHGCQQPPSITQRDPIFGFDLMLRLHRALKRNHRNKSIVQLFSSHGLTFCAPSSTSTKFYTIEPKNLQTIFSTDASSWGVEPMRRFAFEPFVGKGIMCVDGKDWEHSRTLIKPTFARAQITDQHLEDFERHVDRLIDLIPRDGSTVDLQPLFSRLALDASTEFLFGEALGALKKIGFSNESSEFLQAYNYGQYVLGKRLHLPKWNFLTVDKRFQRSCRVAHAFVDECIARTQRALRGSQGHDKTRERYVLARDLVSQTIDMKDARNQLLNVFLPAHEAVGVALTNTFFNLARNPRVFSKLRQEVLKAGAQGKPWTFERLKGIKYLQYIINESFRLNPSIGTNTRMALNDTILPTGGGLRGTSPMYVRKGDVTTTSFYALHRSKDVFGEDADIFKPERWEGLRPPPWSFLPFGGGPRVCPGQNLALTEISYALVRIVEAFERIENRDPVMEFVEVYKITTDSGNGAKVALFSERR